MMTEYFLANYPYSVYKPVEKKTEIMVFLENKDTLTFLNMTLYQPEANKHV